MFLLATSALLAVSPGAHAAPGARAASKPKAQQVRKPAPAKRPGKPGTQVSAKVQKAAKARKKASVSFKAEFKGERISDAAIVEAVRSGFAAYLREPKARMQMTRGQWNRMDPGSVRVKSVTIENDTSSNLGWGLKKGERMFTATVEVKKIENGRPRIVTAQVRSVIVIGPQEPRFGGRVSGTPELKAEDMRYLGNPSTVGWID